MSIAAVYFLLALLILAFLVVLAITILFFIGGE